MKITAIPFLDVLIVIGFLAIMMFLLIVSICLVSGNKSKYEQKIEDDEQMKYVSEEYNKRKGSKK